MFPPHNYYTYMLKLAYFFSRARYLSSTSIGPSSNSSNSTWRPVATAAVTAAIGFSAFSFYHHQKEDRRLSAPSLPEVEPLIIPQPEQSTRAPTSTVAEENEEKRGEGDNNALPIYDRAEVARHNTKGDVWVTFQGDVYDISEFVSMHPGV